MIFDFNVKANFFFCFGSFLNVTWGFAPLGLKLGEIDAKPMFDPWSKLNGLTNGVKEGFYLFTHENKKIKSLSPLSFINPFTSLFIYFLCFLIQTLIFSSSHPSFSYPSCIPLVGIWSFIQVNNNKQKLGR